MTREEFVERWKRVLVGGFMYGYVDDVHNSPAQQADKFLKVCPEVEKLLGAMHTDAQPKPLGKPNEHPDKPTSPTKP